MYPETYYLDLNFNSIRDSIASAGLSGMAAVIFAWIFSTTLIITWLLILGMLGMRILLIYTFYALFPIIIAGWIVDVGPAKYVRMFSGLMIKLTVFLLAIEVILAAVLGVGGAIITADGGGGAELASEDIAEDPYDLQGEYLGPDEDQRKSSGAYAGDTSGSLDSGSQDFGSSPSTFTTTWIQIFTYLSAQWICIVLIAMTLGSTISTGFSSLAKGQTLSSQFAGKIQNGLSKKLDEKGIGDFGGNKVSTDGDKTSIETGGGEVTIDNHGNVSTTESSTISEAPSQKTIKGEVENMTDKMTLGGYSKVKKGATKVGGEMKDVGGDVPVVGSAGRLISRSGKAYGRILKAPNMAASMGETLDILRESPIAHPNKPREQSTDIDANLSKSDTPLRDLKDTLENDDEFEQWDDKNVGDIDQLRYEGRNRTEEYEVTDDGGNIIDTHQMQRGELVNPETDEKMPAVSFKTDDGAPQLEDGATYDLQNVGVKKWHENAQRAHEGAGKYSDKEGFYDQVRLTPQSGVDKISESGHSDDVQWDNERRKG